MKISDLVQVLEGLQDQHGNVDVVLVDADTEWEWLLSESNFYFSEGGKGTGAAVVIKEGYYNAVGYDWPEVKLADVTEQSTSQTRSDSQKGSVNHG